MVDPVGLRELRPDRVERGERGERVLEDHRDPGAAQPPQPGLGSADHLGPGHLDAALDPGARGVVQAQGGEPDGGLAGARLPHQAEHFTGRDLQGDPLHGPYERAPCGR